MLGVFFIILFSILIAVVIAAYLDDQRLMECFAQIALFWTIGGSLVFGVSGLHMRENRHPSPSSIRSAIADRADSDALYRAKMKEQWKNKIAVMIQNASDGEKVVADVADLTKLEREIIEEIGCDNRITIKTFESTQYAGHYNPTDYGIEYKSIGWSVSDFAYVHKNRSGHYKHMIVVDFSNPRLTPTLGHVTIFPVNGTGEAIEPHVWDIVNESERAND